MTSRHIEAGSPYHELIRPIGLTAKVALVLEILGEYFRVRSLLRRRDLLGALSTLRGTEARGTDLRRQAIGVRLGHAVTRTLRLLPFDSRCLVRSLVLTSMLARRGIDSVLVIGVSVEPKFGAHAWIESGGQALLPALDTDRLVEL